MSIRQILLRGPPGSGKSTFAKALVSRIPNAKYLSSGDLLRRHFQHNPEGAHAVAQGGLADSALVLKLMQAEYMSCHERGTKVILVDGFPRKLDELKQWLAFSDLPSLVMYFNSPEKLIVEKLKNRWVCQQCGKMYNLYSDANIKQVAPQITGTCESCNGRLTQRADDTEDVIRSRLRLHKSVEGEILQYLSTKVPHKLLQVRSEDDGPSAMAETIIRRLIG